MFEKYNPHFIYITYKKLISELQLPFLIIFHYLAFFNIWSNNKVLQIDIFKNI